MREILFRGKRTDNGEWICGDLSRCDELVAVVPFTTNFDYLKCKVISETVGQHTGMYDKNGVNIFEGDIISDEVRSKEDNIFICEYVNTEGSFIFVSPFDGECLDENNFCEDLKIIGNIHDNPELIL